MNIDKNDRHINVYKYVTNNYNNKGKYEHMK